MIVIILSELFLGWFSWGIWPVCY